MFRNNKHTLAYAGRTAESAAGTAELNRRALGGRCGRQGSSIVILGEPDANYAAPRAPVKVSDGGGGGG
jgi:hypothetical protein